jgi:hypothetical protein
VRVLGVEDGAETDDILANFLNFSLLFFQKISWAIKRLFVLRKQKRTRDRIGCRNGGEIKAKQAQFK